jgi:hypothetical protein
MIASSILRSSQRAVSKFPVPEIGQVTQAISTLLPTRLAPSDFLVLSGQLQVSPKLGPHSVQLSGIDYRSKPFRNATSFLPDRVPFPPGTMGFLYCHAGLSHAPIAAHLRFRIMPSDNPADFERGHDLMIHEDMPWMRPLSRLLIDIEHHRKPASESLLYGLELFLRKKVVSPPSSRSDHDTRQDAESLDGSKSSAVWTDDVVPMQALDALGAIQDENIRSAWPLVHSIGQPIFCELGSDLGFNRLNSQIYAARDHTISGGVPFWRNYLSRNGKGRGHPIYRGA